MKEDTQGCNAGSGSEMELSEEKLQEAKQLQSENHSPCSKFEVSNVSDFLTYFNSLENGDSLLKKFGLEFPDHSGRMFYAQLSSIAENTKTDVIFHGFFPVGKLPEKFGKLQRDVDLFIFGFVDAMHKEKKRRVFFHPVSHIPHRCPGWVDASGNVTKLAVAIQHASIVSFAKCHFLPETIWYPDIVSTGLRMNSVHLNGFESYGGGCFQCQ